MYIAAGEFLNHPDLGDDVAGGLLFLDLLVDEPLEHGLGRVVVFLHSQRKDVVDRLADLALVRQRLLEYFQRRAEVQRRLLDGLKLHAAVAVVDELEELHRVGCLFLVLDAHPVGCTGQVLGLEIGGHGKVDVGGV